uniref:Uncharacterized protein n=1 Tax=Palpitomonas bilix TaxID=652834 RepID=A0A7S3DH30_9EUKA|mmetsp:Transcript_37535/g.96884  ORF Transcript_37535/g.96884 Transcript_37535/m.96884 type:complete len:149 (+) Transcript_37535:34-480(+)
MNLALEATNKVDTNNGPTLPTGRNSAHVYDTRTSFHEGSSRALCRTRTNKIGKKAPKCMQYLSSQAQEEERTQKQYKRRANAKERRKFVHKRDPTRKNVHINNSFFLLALAPIFLQCGGRREHYVAFLSGTGAVFTHFTLFSYFISSG